MNSRENTPLGAMDGALIDWSDASAPRSLRFDDVYFAREDGLAESRHTFLQGNRLEERWQAGGHRQFTVAETGFGTGLNFLLTWDAWRRHPAAPARLHFLSIELHPLARRDLATALARWPQLAPLAEQLIVQYPPALPGQHRLLFEGGRVTLDLHWGDVQMVLPDLAAGEQAFVDAWYLDGFAPAKNTAMWQPSLLKAAACLSRPGATASTFTAAGDVRRALHSAGFAVEKVPGFGRKRESLRAVLQDRPAAPAPPALTPWDLPRASSATPASAIVLGGGLAGCWSAHALAARGVAVTLLEQGDIASAASGNEQGILYTRLSHKHSALTDFALLSFLFASRSYAHMFETGVLEEHADGALCGNLQAVASEEELARLQAPLEELADLARIVSAAEARDLLGVAPRCGGIWYPASGWMRPASLCHALLSAPSIQVMQHTGALQLRRRDERWQAVDARGRILAEAPCAIVAAGTSSGGQAGLDWLPLRAIRGQTTALPASGESAKLRAALCMEGYIAPARAGTHCIGATFNLDSDSPHPDGADHRDNMNKLAEAVPSWRDALNTIDTAQLPGRVGFRCASPDYLPLVGQVPDREACLDDYAEIRTNARRVVARRGDYVSGLYLNSAHGSRGLTSTPLAAELLAATICNEPLPLERYLRRAIAPARFILRDLARNLA